MFYWLSDPHTLKNRDLKSWRFKMMFRSHRHTQVYPWSWGQVSIWKLFDSLNPKPRVLFQSSGTISEQLDTMNLTDNQIFLLRVWFGLLCSYYAVWKRTGNGVWGEVEERRLRPLFSSTLITWNSGNCRGSISDTVYPFRNNHLISLPSPGAKKKKKRALSWYNLTPLSLSPLQWLTVFSKQKLPHQKLLQY